MDSSPKPSKKSNTANSPSSNPVQVQSQESPISTYISNLSPIKPFKVASAPQGFPGLNSPTFVFGSSEISSDLDSDFRKRPQLVRLSGKDENFREAVIVAEESGISNAQSSSGLNPCAQNAIVNNNFSPDKASSPLASADDLTSVAKRGGSTFDCSAHIPQSVNGLVDSTKSEIKLADEDRKGKDKMATGESPLMSEQAEEEIHLLKPSSTLKPAETEEKPGADNIPSEPCIGVESSSPIDCASYKQHGRYSKAENEVTGKEAEWESTSQLGSQQNVEDQGNRGEHTDAQCAEAGQNEMQHDHIPKVGVQQRGVHRRCLQFEDAQKETLGKSICAHSLSGTAGFPISTASSEVLEVLESSSLDKPAIPSNELLANVNQPTFPSQNSIKFMEVPKGLSIGLHLNSIVNAFQRGSWSIPGKKSSSTISCHLAENCSISLNRAEAVSVSSENSRHDSVASIAASSAASFSPYGVKNLNDSLLLKPIDFQHNPYEKRISSSENTDSVDDFSPSSPKKKRKKTPDTSDSNGCKRCNCKKTKCLKLYCDCFAAGIYCAEPCACQGCFNRPEYEDTVLETRQQIESRNPIAFAPKVIQCINEPPASSSGDDGTHYTPASARHKRGCNCKKSKCLKKYCECYQSNVGCSDGCRCEGCENMYGRKGEYSIIKDLASNHDKDEIQDGSFDNNLELVAPRDTLLHNELCNPHNLTPLTPSFQCSDHGQAASKSWFSSERYLPSPESGINFLAPYGMSQGPAMNSDNHGVIPETNNEIMDLVSLDQELEFGNGDTMNQFSPGFDGPRDAGYLPAGMANPQNSASMLRTQMFPGNHYVSPASSLRWNSSPINPMTHFGGSKLEGADFHDRLYGMLDDDTPDILKESSTPPNAVKVSSPNKKRVSPPHGHQSATGSSSSAGLRSGRKFILQAVPSFPPLTPCIDSKLYAGQNKNDSQDCSRK